MPIAPVRRIQQSRLQRRLAPLLLRAAAGLETTRPGRFALDCVRAAAAVVRGFRGEQITLRASALTYITMLSLVPLLAVLFAIVKALGQDRLRREVHEFLFMNLAPGAREQVGTYLDQFIARASSGAMGGLGGVMLLVSAVTLLHNIESSLNAIWGVTRPRPLLHRILIFWTTLTLGPVALGTSLVATGEVRMLLERGGMVPSGAWSLIPIGTTVLTLTFVYLAAPNARVRLRAALGGGLVAGLLWEGAKHLYAHYAVHSFRYSAIYGSLGAVPLFLLWVYVSWLLLLFGARLAYALQNAYIAPADLHVETPRGWEVLCSRVAVGIAARFLGGEEPPTPRQVSRLIGVDVAFVREAARALKDGGLLAETPEGGLVPARPPAQISLADISTVARGTLLPPPPQLEPGDGIQRLWQTFAGADTAARAALEGFTLESLVLRTEPRIEKKANPAG